MIDYSLYVITDRTIQGVLSTALMVEQAMEGGATVIQLRDKNATSRVFLEEALIIRELTRKTGVSFIVNDRIDIALACGADGVHLGEEDIPLSFARRIASGLILGYSVDSVEKAQEAERRGASYLGVGTIFPTRTKMDAGNPIGTEMLRAIKRAVKIPVVAIGGISLSLVDEVIQAGADGVAVISAVVGAPSVVGAAREFREKIRILRSNRP
ncbi:MAG: thiamine phosphate synthase [Candidatus Atribacteria bacterium]|nr:thiamine phosphate synthase [Candidatus Atribacteria bacterium]